MSTVKAVLFDYGLVLSGPPDPAAWECMKRLLGANEAAFHTAYWKHREAYDRGSLTAEAYWRQIAEDLHRSLDENEIRQLIDIDTDVWTQPNQPMIDWAAALQRAGMKTGILSNIGAAMEVGVLARCPWLADFTHHTFSHRLQIAKPDPAIYRHAAEGLNVAPQNILFIDDREENIVAAHAAGMQAVRYTTHDAFLRAMKDYGYESLLNP
ncbi:MAG TPA: HAD family phosphatase [Acidobacteriaceae bacterium]|nr:HAD family phosphatase [Acidobacteriaceae bacterium]